MLLRMFSLLNAMENEGFEHGTELRIVIKKNSKHFNVSAAFTTPYF